MSLPSIIVYATKAGAQSQLVKKASPAIAVFLVVPERALSHVPVANEPNYQSILTLKKIISHHLGL